MLVTLSVELQFFNTIEVLLYVEVYYYLYDDDDEGVVSFVLRALTRYRAFHCVIKGKVTKVWAAIVVRIARYS